MPGDVPSSITLDHGDLLVMDGSAQSEYAHCTVPGLQGPRVNLTYRWVTQHAASCPLAGAVVVCSQRVRKVQSSQVPVGLGESKWSSCWSLVLLLLILVSVLLISTWIHTWRGLRYSDQRPSRPAVYFPSRGRARWVGRRRWRLSRRRQSSQRASFYFSFISFLERKTMLYFGSMVSYFCTLLGLPVAMWEPTPCYRDANSVGTPKWACWWKGWQTCCRTTFSPLYRRFFLVSKRTFFFFFWSSCMDVPYWCGQASWAWPTGFHLCSAVH